MVEKEAAQGSFGAVGAGLGIEGGEDVDGGRVVERQYAPQEAVAFVAAGPPLDAVIMFKVLVLQALYGLAEEQTEFQIRDRLSFNRLDANLRDSGYLAMGGQMIDASIIAAPRQRNTDAEKADLMAGCIPKTGRRTRRSCARKTVTGAGP